MDPTLSLAHTVQSSKGTVAFLLGSGVSRASGIPTGWEVTLNLVRRVAAMEGVDPGSDPAAWYERRYGTAPGYSTLLDSLARKPAERRAILHSLFEPSDEEREQGLKLPTPAHRAIAELVAKGFARVVVTTNFDRLMETALQDAGVVPTVISTADAVRGAAPLVHQRCVVLKIHGDYLDDRIMNTDEELAAYDPVMDAYIDRILDEFGLVVCGWSGEWDPALRTAIERCPSRRYATYWTGMGEPSATVAKLIRLRDARFLRIAGADAFLSDLRDKVISLDDLSSPDPLTVGAAVASVKRFIAEPKYRIRFDDFFADEVRRARERHVQGMRMDEQVINKATVVRRFQTYDASMETLVPMLFNAARWAGAEHEDTILRTIASLVPIDRVGGYSIWIGLRQYPAVLAFHAVCAGALAAGNYGLFRNVCDLRLRSHGRLGRALPDLAAASVGNDAANQLHAQKRYTPLSDHLVRVLDPVLSTSTRDPERAFERLEVMLALESLDRTDDPLGKAYLLPGRFIWKHEDAAYAEIFAEAEEAEDAWPPLRAGMFRASADRFTKVREGFEAKLAERGSYW